MPCRHDPRKLVALGALDDVVQDEHGAVVGRFKDEYILIIGSFMVKNFFNFKGHCLARPHGGYFTEPAICVELSKTT